jgi:adenine-specific DNA-methyltransferase
VVKPFGDPIYSSLTPLGAIYKDSGLSAHAVINAENYHPLQLLLYLYEGLFDCLYLDPPYNTGAKD